MKLTEKNNDFDSIYDLKPHQYSIFIVSEGSLAGIHFKCPGCNQPLGIHNHLAARPGGPSWQIDFDSLTATPSIRHDKYLGGCGWHGYLTNAELIGQIE